MNDNNDEGLTLNKLFSKMADDNRNVIKVRPTGHGTERVVLAKNE